MKNIGQLMKQAQQMQTKISALKKELADREVESSSGGGVVKVKVNGKTGNLDIVISPDCVDPTDVETLQDLIKIAVNQGVKESQDMVSNAMSKVTGGVDVPGMF